MTQSTFEVHAVASGYNYTVFIDCETDGRDVYEGTAEKTIGGWMPSRQAAEQKAREVLQREQIE